METKRWRLVVSEAGADDPLHDVTVSAKQWRTALQRGRAQIGEPGGVPKGSSYAVAPDGTVTITDNIENRVYTLTKLRTSKTRRPSTPSPKPAPPPKAKPKEVEPPPAEEAPEEEPAEPKSSESTSDASPSPEEEESATPATEEESKAEEPSEGERWSLLHQVDHAPTDTLPVLYIERSYHVKGETSSDEVEAILRERLDWLRSQHELPPQGKLFRLAAFDTAWEGHPSEDPIGVLELRDWRGKVRFEWLKPADEPVAEPESTEASQKASAPEGSLPQHENIQISMPPPSPQRGEEKKSGKKRTRTSTDEHDARLAHAFEGCQDLFFCETPADSLNFIVDLLQDLLPTDASSALLYDYNHDEFLFVSVTGPKSEELAGTTVPGGKGLLAAAVYSENTVVVAGAKTDSRYDAQVDERDDVSGDHQLVQPLVKGGRILGTIRLQDRSDGKAFSQADADLLDYIGRQVAKFISEARNRGERR